VKYVVQLNEERRSVSIETDGLRYESDLPVHGELINVENSPVKMVRIGTNVYRVVARKLVGRGKYTLWVDGYRFEVEALDERTRAIRDLSSASAGPVGPAPIVAPMPGLVVRVNVAVGDRVQAGQGVVVMEAMKMENELRATGEGIVKSIAVAPGAAVEKGTLLVELE
jgi:biotin carboxyl carrier protein